MARLVLCALLVVFSATQARAERPLVGESLAVDRILIAEPGIARQWLAATEADEPTADPKPHVESAELDGVDEAVVVALYVFLTDAKPAEAVTLLSVFEHGHHGYLARLSPTMVAAFAKSRVDQDLLSGVEDLAAQLRGMRPDAEWAPLTPRSLRRIRKVSRAATGERSVFLYLSE